MYVTSKVKCSGPGMLDHYKVMPPVEANGEKSHQMKTAMSFIKFVGVKVPITRSDLRNLDNVIQ